MYVLGLDWIIGRVETEFFYLLIDFIHPQADNSFIPLLFYLGRRMEWLPLVANPTTQCVTLHSPQASRTSATLGVCAAFFWGGLLAQDHWNQAPMKFTRILLMEMGLCTCPPIPTIIVNKQKALNLTSYQRNANEMILHFTSVRVAITKKFTTAHAGKNMDKC